MAQEFAPDTLVKQGYNETPYQSFPFNQTHPTHLFTLATLFGLSPTPIEKARVLELGCAAGGNLMPVAHAFPEAEFVGIDLAEKQVEDGLKQIKGMELSNIQLRHQSIMDFGKEDGKFDYIICHGVYSWVDKEVRDKIFQIYRQNLTPNGVGYISYNTFPGWNMVNSVRELMLWHTKNLTDPATKVQQARSILKFITTGLENDQSPYATFLKNEINLLSNYADYYLLHEHLSPYNQPCYFYEFMEEAGKNQLSYLSDVYLPMMFADNLPAVFSKELNKLENIIVSGQYMDFIRNQRFRCTLLCQQEQTVNRALKTADVEKFYLQLIATPAIAELSEKDLAEGKEIAFSSGNITLTIRPLLSQIAMLILFEERHRPIHYQELCEKVIQRGPEKNKEAVKKHLNDNLNIMRIALAGLINLSSYAPQYTIELPEKPVACPLARYQAQMQNFVTNRRHQPISLDPFTKALLPQLDGSKDLDMLAKFTATQIKAGQLTLLDKEKKPVTDHYEIKRHALNACKLTLEKIITQALIVPCKKAG